jgi:hypothetical protein
VAREVPERAAAEGGEDRKSCLPGSHGLSSIVNNICPAMESFRRRSFRAGLAPETSFRDQSLGRPESCPTRRTQPRTDRVQIDAGAWRMGRARLAHRVCGLILFNCNKGTEVLAWPTHALSTPQTPKRKWFSRSYDTGDSCDAVFLCIDLLDLVGQPCVDLVPCIRWDCISSRPPKRRNRSCILQIPIPPPAGGFASQNPFLGHKP